MSQRALQREMKTGADSITVKSLGRDRGGTQSALAYISETQAAKLLTEGGRVKVGWVICILQK